MEGWKLPAHRHIAAFGEFDHALMRTKLGLTREMEGDNQLIGGLLAVMARAKADYTLST